MSDSDMRLPTAELFHSEKKVRFRKKSLYRAVAQQMDFYFSDVNLSRDRFLKKEYDTTPDGYIPLQLFMKFNKIKEMNVSVEDLSKAVAYFSKLLVLNENKTKVKRSTPYSPPVNEDERTVYVEGIPAFATHEWVKGLMSQYGEVEYVSLPRYPSTKELKGFAFVEFVREPEAKACLKAIGTKEFDSVRPFPKAGSKDIQRLEKAVNQTLHTPDQPPEEIQETHTTKKKTMRRTISSQSTEEQPVAVNIKTEPKIKKDIKLKTEPIDPECSKKRKRKTSKNEAEDDTDASAQKIVKMSDSTNTLAPAVKSETVKKNEMSVKTENNPNVKEEASDEGYYDGLPQLKAISKLDWLALRNKYMQSQKEKTSSLKKQLKALRSDETKEENNKTSDLNPLEMTHNVVVKILGKEELDRAVLKDHLPKGVTVSYIDTQIGSPQGFIRCETAEDAKLLLTLTCGDNYILSLLQGKDEEQYWDKLNQERMERRQNTTKKKKSSQRRGKKKVLDQEGKVSKQQKKHIVFDDD